MKPNSKIIEDKHKEKEFLKRILNKLVLVETSLKEYIDYLIIKTTIDIAKTPENRRDVLFKQLEQYSAMLLLIPDLTKKIERLENE